MHIDNLIQKFTIHNPNEAPWLSRLTDIYPESLSMKKMSKSLASSFTLTWMDSVRNELHEVVVDLTPVYRNINKPMGEFWSPPTYFDDEETVLGKKKLAIAGKPLLVNYNPAKQGWTLNYHYADEIIFEHLRRNQPTALVAFRLLKALRDATLPWTCVSNPRTKEVEGVKQLVRSFVLQNMFFHELVQESDVNDWSKDRILYRIIGMLQKLNGLVQYREDSWESQANVYNPGQNTLLGKPLPVTADVQRLIGLLNLRNQQYVKGSVSINKACHTPNKTETAEETDEEKCIKSWNHHYFLRFTKPTPTNQCKQLLYTDIRSAGGMFPVEAPSKKKVRMFQESSGINLDRYLSDGKAKIMVVSWNSMESENVPKALHKMVITGRKHDIYVIGTQETKSNRKEWEDRLLSVLGDNYSVFHSGNHWALSLIILMKNDLIPFATDAEEDHVTISPKIRWIFKTKGAIAACFKLFDTSLLFVNCHLTARDGMMKKRIEDFHEICQDLDLPRQKKGKTKGDVTANFDCVFWLGDLNFHMSGGRKRWRKPDVDIASVMEKHDELQAIQKEGKAFKNFKEGKIRFPPTFRYDPGTTRIHIKRDEENPSYTDRILYKCKDPVGAKCLHYDIIMDVLESDHKPVQAVFRVPIRSDDKAGKSAAKDSPALQTRKPRVGTASPRLMRVERPTPPMMPYPAEVVGLPYMKYPRAAGRGPPPPSMRQGPMPPRHPQPLPARRQVPTQQERLGVVVYNENIPMHTPSVTSFSTPANAGLVPVPAATQVIQAPPAINIGANGMKSVFGPGNNVYSSKDFAWQMR